MSVRLVVHHKGLKAGTVRRCDFECLSFLLCKTIFIVFFWSNLWPNHSIWCSAFDTTSLKNRLKVCESPIIHLTGVSCIIILYASTSLFEECYFHFQHCYAFLSFQIKGVEVDEGLVTLSSYFSEDLPPLSKVLLLICENLHPMLSYVSAILESSCTHS